MHFFKHEKMTSHYSYFHTLWRKCWSAKKGSGKSGIKMMTSKISIASTNRIVHAGSAGDLLLASRQN